MTALHARVVKEVVQTALQTPVFISENPGNMDKK